jgi:hypothetical protein
MSRQLWRASSDLDMAGARQIGELAVDRESMERVLSDSPQSLQTILDALMDALRQEASSPYKAVESEEEEELPAIPQNHRFPSGIGSWNPTFQKTKGGPPAEKQCYWEL